MPDRPMRYCDVCGGLDDHPRHVHAAPAGVVIRHLDCCASRGCETCQATEAETEGRRGQELIDHLAEVRASNG